jgi:hypothetical protein
LIVIGGYKSLGSSKEFAYFVPLILLRPWSKGFLISKKIMEIKSAVERVYSLNMKMIQFAVTFYAYIRWLS